MSATPKAKRPTPETDAFFARNSSLMEKWDKMSEIERQRDELRELYGNQIDMWQRAERQLAEVTKQRDALAGLLEKSIRYIHDPHEANCIATLKGDKP